MPILQHIFKKKQKQEAPQRLRGKIKEDRKQEKKETHSSKQEEKQKKLQPSAEQSKSKDKKSVTSAVKIESAHAAYGVVVRPHISEKSVAGNNQGKYVFEVASSVNKKQIQNAIEVMYSVKVKSVNKIKVPAKKMQYRRQKGTKSRHNKAIVTLKKGQEIEVLPQ